MAINVLQRQKNPNKFFILWVQRRADLKLLVIFTWNCVPISNIYPKFQACTEVGIDGTL